MKKWVLNVVALWIMVWFGLGNVALFTAFLLGKSVSEPSVLVAIVELSCSVAGTIVLIYFWRKRVRI